MAFVKLDVNAAVWSNIEDESRTLASESKHDVMKDLAGSTVRRPALISHVTGYPAAPDGQYYWENTDTKYIVAGGDLYSENQNGVKTLIASNLFEVGTRVVWAEVGDTTIVTPGAVRKIFATNGGRIVEFDGTTAQKLTDGDAPTQSTFIAVLDTYLISNDLSDPSKDESFFYSEVADPTSWLGEFASAEGSPDKLNGLLVGWNELTLFGTSTIEPWYTATSGGFTPLKASIIEQGTKAPYTIQKVDNAWFLLNTNRRMIRIDGRQPSIISQPIDDILDGLTDYGDPEADVITGNGKALYLLSVADTTLVFDYSINEWLGEWNFWDKDKSEYTRFKGRNILNIKPWGETHCTDHKEGIVYKLDFDKYEDDGEEIRSSIITGIFDHGTGREKRSNELRLRVKRGKGDPNGEEPLILVRYRDNGTRTWNNIIEVPIGYEGEDEMYYSVFDQGSYRSRQYEIFCTDNTPFVVVGVEEDVEILR